MSGYYTTLLAERQELTRAEKYAKIYSLLRDKAYERERDVRPTHIL